MFFIIKWYIKTHGFISLTKVLVQKILSWSWIYRYILYLHKYPTCRITMNSTLGDVICWKRVSIWWAHIGNSSIWNNTYIWWMGTSIANTDIGKYCSINAGVKIPPKGQIDQMSLPSTYPFYNVILSPFFDPNWMKEEKMKRTTIGNDVFIWTNAIILGWVTIGNGAVIWAGTIVTEDVPPYTICVGVPGKVIRKRFDEETISYLQNLNWWDKSDNEIKDLLPYLSRSIMSSNAA